LQQTVLEVPVDLEEFTLYAEGAGPEVEEITTTIPLSDIALFSLSGKVKPFGAGLEIKASDITNNMLSPMLTNAIAGLGRSHAAHVPQYLLGTKLAAFESTNCYDGQYFFDTDHPAGSTTDSNKLTKTDLAADPSTTTVTVAEAQAIFEQMRYAIVTALDNTGAYIEPEVSEWIMICNELHGNNVRWAFNPQNVLQSQSSNQYSGFNVRVVTSPRTTATKFYLINNSPSAPRPFNLAMYKQPMQEMGVKNVQTQRYPEISFGMYELMPGAWQPACVLTGSTS
jgi:hypothetical protein